MFSSAPQLRADTPPGVLAFTVEVPGSKLSADDVTQVVRRTAIRRGWSIKESTTEKTVIYLNARKNEATVTYLVSEKQIQAYCEGYATNGKGTRKGPEQPTGWLNNLKKDINKSLDEAVYLDRK